MKRNRSLTRRVLGTVLLLELVSATVFIAASVAHEWHSRLSAFDVMLRGQADTLLGAVDDSEDRADDVMLTMTGLAIPSRDLYLVRDNRSGVLGQSKIPIPSGLFTLAGSPNHGLTIKIQGRYYRIVRLIGTRIVDPGDAGGGVRHTVTVFYGSPTHHIWHDVIEAVRFYAIATILLFSITGIIMVWLLRRDLAPLHQLATEAGKVSTKNWAFQAPRAARETKELIPLAQAIESALARLQRSFEQQRRLTSDAAHELKTDVAIVKSSLQLLTMRSRTTSEYQQGLELCLDDCSRLERTVQQMLALARVEHEESVPGRDRKGDPFSLRASIEKSIRHLKSSAELRRITIVLDTDADANVEVDEGDCTHLLSNLLLNALQHSPAETTVTVGMNVENGRARITIQDQGEGIAPDDLPHIFEPFYRGDPSRSRESGGTGLGLAICKAICERSGGSIQIVNVPGGGARATIELPLAG